MLYPPFIYICCSFTWVLLTLNIILLEIKTFTLNYLTLLIQLANKWQLWIYSNFHFQRKCCQKWCSHENVSWFFINCNSNGRNFYFWFDWDFFSIDFFLNLQIHLHSIFHFSFLVGLWLLSIDIFLNRNSNGRNFIFDLIEIFIQSPNTPTCYFSLFLSSWIEIVINWYFSQSLSTHICNYI